jgi:hypothetical protein
MTKQYEIRATYVDGKIFSAKLWNPQGHERVIDWRPPEEFRALAHEAVATPDHIRDFCLAFMESYNLRYGAFDFTVDENEVYTFLELNPNGQWLWIERLTGYPISRAIAWALTHEGETDG